MVLKYTMMDVLLVSDDGFYYLKFVIKDVMMACVTLIPLNRLLVKFYLPFGLT